MFAYANPKQKQQLKAKEGVPRQKNFSITPNMTGIPGSLKNQFENFSGFSFDDVRVHYHSDKPAQLQARAYTQGNHVYLASGQEKYLGHELGHVVQQKQGRVSPRIQRRGYAVNDDSCMEREADLIYEHSKHSSVIPCFDLETTENSIGIVQCQNITWDVNPEDLLYGLTTDRRKYAAKMDEINTHFQTQTGPVLEPYYLEYPIIVDYMNNTFLGTGVNHTYGTSETENPDVTGTKKYRDFHRYFCLLMEKKIPKGSTPADISTRIRAACKFGIWLTVKMGHHIHFVLDGIYNKDSQQDFAEGSDKYTAEELRYVRTEWEDKDFKDGLLFYNQHKIVDAPWVSPYEEQWKNYRKETLNIDPMAEYLVNPTKLEDLVSECCKIMIMICEKVAEYDSRMQELENIILEINRTNQWINEERQQAGCIDTLLSCFGIQGKVEKRIRPKILYLEELQGKRVVCTQELHELKELLRVGLNVFEIPFGVLKKFQEFYHRLLIE